MSLNASLQSAARLAIAHENSRGAINMQRWAATYRCAVDDVIEAFRIAENGSRKLPEEIAATVPTITDDMMEGK